MINWIFPRSHIFHHRTLQASSCYFINILKKGFSPLNNPSNKALKSYQIQTFNGKFFHFPEMMMKKLMEFFFIYFRLLFNRNDKLRITVVHHHITNSVYPSHNPIYIINTIVRWVLFSLNHRKKKKKKQNKTKTTTMKEITLNLTKPNSFINHNHKWIPNKICWKLKRANKDYLEGNKEVLEKLFTAKSKIIWKVFKTFNKQIILC